MIPELKPMARHLRTLALPFCATCLAMLALVWGAMKCAAADRDLPQGDGANIILESYAARFDELERELGGADSPEAACPCVPEGRRIGEAWYKAGYDDGFLIAPVYPEETPYSLKFNMQNELRYVGFARDVQSWRDNAGNVFPVSNESNFELTRGRLRFSGFVFRPEVEYSLELDYNTTANTQFGFRSYSLGYRWNDGLTLALGQGKVPGSRDWLTSFVYSMGADRSLATTFFRPGLSTGVWAIGEPAEGLHYHAMVANGFSTLGASIADQSSNLALAASVWYEPWGDFGPGSSDYEWHDDPAVRGGGSFTYAPVAGQQGNPDQPEDFDLRLSDGTSLTETGALAPGVSLSKYTVALGSIDLAFKYRGIGVCGELFLRELYELQGNGPLPRSSIFDLGGFVQAGAYIVPKRFELFARTAHVSGPYGTGAEYAGGLNWFVLRDKRNLRYTFDAAWVDHSPADQVRTNYRAVDTGLLIRTQLQMFF
jgi:hypothetical protein